MKRLVNSFLKRMQRQRTRRQLGELSPEALDDIGISYPKARQESRKHFWQ